MTDEKEVIVTTLLAQKGEKFDEDQTCVSWHDGSIVFLPADVKPGEVVRVSLHEVEGGKVSGGMTTYFARHAPVPVSDEQLQRIRDEAERLLAMRHFDRETGEAVLGQNRVMIEAWKGYRHYYLDESGAAYGSAFSPATLSLFQHLERGVGLTEPLLWILGGLKPSRSSLYRKRERGEPIDRHFSAPSLDDAGLSRRVNEAQLKVFVGQDLTGPQIEWSNQMQSRSRDPWLLFVIGDKIVRFRGHSMPDVVVVTRASFTKQGKWSHTTYQLQLAQDVRVISGVDGWDTDTFLEGLSSAVGCTLPDTWEDAANALGVSVSSAMRFLRGWRPREAAKLDENERALSDLGASSRQDAASVLITVSFGSPTNRAIRNGYWEAPKRVPGYNAEIRLKDRSQGWSKGNIEVVGITGTVLSVTHSRGMHGGTYAVSIAVVPGTESEIPPFETAREKAAKESGLPESLYHAFGGDTERVQAFMEKVAKLDVTKLDGHEMSCGRARKQAEVIRVSGDPDFFLGADPNEVCDYLLESGSTSMQENGSGTALGAALKKAGL